eukprot:TRINITY_DN3412_c0_g1_i2.p1 TRINITY_DN3412_c0_g1~~TRINITY_DN3412_c0_g1_i2.p1  ORF type:complete len:594 (-),score=70.54 TRINITY_DN3412_c0_g1_i2:292-1899(-)
MKNYRTSCDPLVVPKKMQNMSGDSPLRVSFAQKRSEVRSLDSVAEVTSIDSVEASDTSAFAERCRNGSACKNDSSFVVPQKMKNGFGDSSLRVPFAQKRSETRFPQSDAVSTQSTSIVSSEQADISVAVASSRIFAPSFTQKRFMARMGRTVDEIESACSTLGAIGMNNYQASCDSLVMPQSMESMSGDSPLRVSFAQKRSEVRFLDSDAEVAPIASAEASEASAVAERCRNRSPCKNASYCASYDSFVVPQVVESEFGDSSSRVPFAQKRSEMRSPQADASVSAESSQQSATFGPFDASSRLSAPLFTQKRFMARMGRTVDEIESVCSALDAIGMNCYQASCDPFVVPQLMENMSRDSPLRASFVQKRSDVRFSQLGVGFTLIASPEPSDTSAVAERCQKDSSQAPSGSRFVPESVANGFADSSLSVPFAQKRSEMRFPQSDAASAPIASSEKVNTSAVATALGASVRFTQKRFMARMGSTVDEVELPRFTSGAAGVFASSVPKSAEPAIRGFGQARCAARLADLESAEFTDLF